VKELVVQVVVDLVVVVFSAYKNSILAV